MSLINREALLSILEEQRLLWKSRAPEDRITWPACTMAVETADKAVATIIDFVQHMPAAAVTREDIPIAALELDVREMLSLADAAREQVSQAHRKLLNVLKVLQGGG